MLSWIKKMFGKGTDFRTLHLEGACIIDVRTPAEYKSGHIKGSVNVPLQELAGKLQELNKNKPIIVCCASGMRSASATSILKQKGFEAYNGGGWQSLERKL